VTTYYFFGGDAGNPDDYVIQDPDNPANYEAPDDAPGPGDEVDANGTLTGGTLDVGSVQAAASNSPIGGGGLTIDGGSVIASIGDDIILDDGSLSISGTGTNISVGEGEATVETLYNGGVSEGSLSVDNATGDISAGGGGSLQISSLDLVSTPGSGIVSDSLSVDGAGTVATIGSIAFGAADDDQGSIDITDDGVLSTGSITLGVAGGAYDTIELAGAGSTLTAKGGLTFVNGELDVLDSASYTPSGGSLTLGVDAGSFGEIDVAGGGDLTVSGAFNLGRAGQGELSEGDDGVVSVDGDITIDRGTVLMYAGALNVARDMVIDDGVLQMSGGTVTVSNDLSLVDTGAYRGNIYQTGGMIEVDGTASIGESSFVSDQFLIQSVPDDDLATFQAENIVFGSQSVTTGENGNPVYTEITDGSLDLAGDLIANNSLTLNPESYIFVDDNTNGGAISSAAVEVGGNLYDTGGGVNASGANVDVTVGGSVHLMDYGSIVLSDGAGLEIGGTGNVQADDAVIEAGASLIGSGMLETAVTGTTTVVDTSLYTYAPVINNGTIEAQGGTLTIDGALSGPGQVLVGPNSNLVLGGAVADDVTIMFLPGGDETITIDDPEDFKGVISSENFEPDDKIDLPFVPYVDPGSTDANPEGASFNFETGEDQQNYVLQVVEDDQTYNIPINQDVQFEGSFKLDDDVHGGTLVTYESDEEPGYSVTADADGTQGCSVLNTEPRV
jgi:hypothetical protein